MVDEMGLSDGQTWEEEYKSLGLIPNPKPSDGGPSTYYDFPTDRPFVTLNDLLEYKAIKHWGAYSLHMKDLVKAAFRFGTKAGVDYEYDTKKMVYSGLRLLIMLRGVKAAETFIEQLRNDPQFKDTK